MGAMPDTGCSGLRQFCARAAGFFTVVSTVGQILVRNRAILRNTLQKRNDELRSVSNDMQSSETLRNSLGLN
jgi:hypothetical protein